MTDYRGMIAAQAVKLRDLHERIHETVRVRSRSDQDYAQWQEACRAFHAYGTPYDDLLARAYQPGRFEDPELVEFAIAYLEADPWHFRSGYHKERLLGRLKRASLSEIQRRRLREVVLDAARRRGMREYRYYCNLAAFVANDVLLGELETLLESDDRAVVRRVRMMLARIRLGTG